MVTRVEPSVRVKAHEKIRVALDPGRVHFFDDLYGLDRRLDAALRQRTLEQRPLH